MQAKVTVAIPSYNQGKYLRAAIESALGQNVVSQVCVADGGSDDDSSDIVREYEAKLWWSRSARDCGQSAAVNEAVTKGNGEYVAWLNSDDRFIDGSLQKMVAFLDEHPEVPAVYGKARYIDECGAFVAPVNTQPFRVGRMKRRCIVCQPATLIRRSVWDALGGVNEDLHMAMDYDLWWRIISKFGDLGYIDEYLAEARLHKDTKTNNNRKKHYLEAMAVVKKYTGAVPVIWYLKWPWSVWYKSLIHARTQR